MATYFLNDMFSLDEVILQEQWELSIHEEPQKVTHGAGPMCV